MSSTNSNSGGVGFFGLLTILFIGLKLGHVIAWSWFWVLSPIIIPIGLAIVIGTIIGIVAGISTRHALKAQAQRRAELVAARRARIGR